MKRHSLLRASQVRWIIVALVLFAVIVLLTLPSTLQREDVYSNIIIPINTLMLYEGIHIHDMTRSGATITVVIHDEGSSQITVSATISGTCDGASVDGSGSSGSVDVNCGNSPFCVTDISASNYAYDSSANEVNACLNWP